MSNCVCDLCVFSVFPYNIWDLYLYQPFKAHHVSLYMGAPPWTLSRPHTEVSARWRRCKTPSVCHMPLLAASPYRSPSPGREARAGARELQAPIAYTVGSVHIERSPPPQLPPRHSKEVHAKSARSEANHHFELVPTS